MCKLNRILIGKTHPLNRTIVLLGRLGHTNENWTRQGAQSGTDFLITLGD